MNRLLWISLLAFFSATASANSLRWITAFRIDGINQNFRSGEIITQPKGTYQFLMSLKYIHDKKAKVMRDCIWLRVPNDEVLGEIRIVTQEKNQECKSWIEGEVLLKEFRAIFFKLTSSELVFNLTLPNGQSRRESLPIFNLSEPKKHQLHGSSAPERRYRGIFFLPVRKGNSKDLVFKRRMESEVSELTRECRLEDGSCADCLMGFHRVWADGWRYYCGIDKCGEKNQAACLRGFKWQRSRDRFSCRLNPSHLYCQPGLSLQCEGEQGICR